MQPKSTEDLKNRKKLEEKPSKVGRKEQIPKEGAQKGKSGLDVLKPFLLNRWVQLAAVLLLLILILLLLIYTHLYFAELQKQAEKDNAVTRIRQFMAKYNESFKNKNEIEAIEGVRVLLKQLNSQREINAEVQASLDIVVQMLQDGWVPFRGHLYYFNESIQTFYIGFKICRDQNAAIANILTYAEEDFLEAEVNRRSPNDDIGYWLGLVKSDKWAWISGVPLRLQFWADGYPRALSGKRVCGYIAKCTQKRKCWKDDFSDKKRKSICKWKGDQRWF